MVSRRDRAAVRPAGGLGAFTSRGGHARSRTAHTAAGLVTITAAMGINTADGAHAGTREASCAVAAEVAEVLSRTPRSYRPPDGTLAFWSLTRLAVRVRREVSRDFDMTT